MRRRIPKLTRMSQDRNYDLDLGVCFVKKRKEKGKDFFFQSMCGYCALEVEYEYVLNHLCMSRVRYVPCWQMKGSLMLGSRIIVGGPIASGVPLCTGVVLSRVEQQSYNWGK